MLKIYIPAQEEWDPVSETFISVKEQTLTLEHSLVSISKWEAKWHKAFLGKSEKTEEEVVDYIRCMTLTQNVSPDVYYCIPKEAYTQINAYIEDPATATYFSEDQKKGSSRETITSELIYYWMIALNIPFECQKWHLNRLLALIRVCSIKNQPSKKMSKSEIMNRNKALNDARRKAHHSRG